VQFSTNNSAISRNGTRYVPLCIVSMKGEQEVVYALYRTVTLPMTLNDPNHPQTTHDFHFGFSFMSQSLSFIRKYRLYHITISLGMTNYPQIAAFRVTIIFNARCTSMQTAVLPQYNPVCQSVSPCVHLSVCL